jgi:DNA processing protein
MNKTISLYKSQSIDIRSTEYPASLKQIDDPPPVIYFRGDWDQEIFDATLSVVGSRKMTGYGEFITEKLVSEIAISGITIISGFMYGIDAVSHQAAVDSGGKTIAVMPCGIELIHPKIQSELYRRILEHNGLIISEYPGIIPPARWTFPKRNRIIAALSPTLLVVEAGIKSGALITADYAFKYGKKIFAIPGPLTSSVSLGTAGLIKRGASIVTDADDILMCYGKFKLKGEKVSGKTPECVKNRGLNKIQKTITSLLSEEALTIDEIIRKSKTHSSAAGAELTILLLKKIVTRKREKYYLTG